MPAAQAPSKVSPAAQAPGKILPAAQAPGKVSPAPQAPGKGGYGGPLERSSGAGEGVRSIRLTGAFGGLGARPDSVQSSHVPHD